MLAVHGMDLLDELGVGAITLAVRALRPGVEPAAGDLEDAAELAYREGLAVLLDEAKLHFCSSAKYANAFFKMSRSMVTSRSFFSSSRTFCAWPVTRPWPGKTSAAGFAVACSFQRCSRLRAIPRCVATSVRDLPSSVTNRTASFLNSGVNV